MKSSRRSVLKTGGIVAASLGAPGVVAASGESNANERTDKLRLRSDGEDPLDPTEIQREKERVLHTQGLTANSGNRLADSEVSAPKGSEIVAYNFDIIDGRPREWVGSVKRTHTGGRESSVLNTNKVADLKRTADKKAEEISKNPDVAVSSSIPDQIDDWNVVYNREDQWTSDHRDNATGLEVTLALRAPQKGCLLPITQRLRENSTDLGLRTVI